MFDLIVALITIALAIWFTTPVREWVVSTLTATVRLGVQVARFAVRACVRTGLGGGLTPTPPGNDTSTLDDYDQLLDVRTPHTNLVGDTGQGKSVLARAIMAYRAKIDPTAEFVIIDPHYKHGSWPPHLSVYGKGRNYDEISGALDNLVAEMSRRYEAYATSDVTFSELNIFVDEVPAVAAHCKNWTNFVTQISAEGRKVRMRLVVMTQSTLVELFGIKGKSDVLKNFTELALGEYVFKALKGSDIEVPTAWQYPVVATKRGVPTLHNAYGLHRVSLPQTMRTWCGYDQVVTSGCVAPGGEFSEQQITQATALLSEQPNLSARALALAMNWGDGSGTYNYKAQRLIALIKANDSQH